MDNFTFYAPTYFDFGKGAEKHVADLIKKFGGHKVLLHYGGGSIKKSGLYDTVISVLKESGLEFCELGGVKPNPRSGLVYEGIELCKKEKVDFILLPVLCIMEISWIFIRARHPLRKRFQSERY